jgi:hypothetical protein
MGTGIESNIWGGNPNRTSNASPYGGYYGGGNQQTNPSSGQGVSGTAGNPQDFGGGGQMVHLAGRDDFGTGSWVTGFDESFDPKDYPGSDDLGWPTGGGGGGGYGGGGGGGGAPQIDMGQVMALLGRKPGQYNWNDFEQADYVGSPYRDFNSGQYDMMRSGITEGLAADQAAGATAYGDARFELEQYQNPFAGRDYATNPEMSGAMQRMMSANNVTPDYADQSRGVQADSAFGNVLALLGANAGNRQASELRALGGDERRFGESLASEGRTMGLGVDMAEAAALEQYEKDKWMYGEEIARMNYQTARETGMYNAQGQQGVAQGNVQLNNEYNQNNTNTLIDLLASGQKITPEMMAALGL